jgi:hypothetical protein
MFVIFSDSRPLEVEGDIHFHYDDDGLIGISFIVKGESKPYMYFLNGLQRISETIPDPPAQFNEPSIDIPSESVDELVGYENMHYSNPNITVDDHVNKDKEISEDFYPDRNF